MDQFNVNASGDSILFEKKHGAERYKAENLIKNYGGEIDTQLILDVIKILGLDIENDREEVIALCQEIGIDPKLLGVTIPGKEISKSEISPSDLLEPKNHDMENEM